MKDIFLAIVLFSMLALTSEVLGQTPGQIHDGSSYTDGDTVSTYNPMDPNEDGYTSIDTTGYSAGVEDNEIEWISIPQLSLEPNNDTDTGGGCGSTDVVDNPAGGGESSYVFFDSSQPDIEYLVYRIRLAQDPSGKFGYSILVDTDGRIGDSDPNAISKNPGFEYEVRVSLANSDGGNVYIENIDGKIDGSSGDDQVTYSQATNFQKANARFQDPDCTGDVQFFDFFIDIADIGLTSSSTVRLAAATSTQPIKGVLSNVSDIAGIDDNVIGNLGDSLATQDDVFIALINLQRPTPISDLGEDGCFKTGTSNTPVVFNPIFDSNTRINGYVDEPEGAFVTVFSNEDTLATGLVSASGFWSVTFDAGDLRTYDEITAIVADSCELNSARSTKVNVINDIDSDEDGILDATDEGNGVDPGGDVDGDGILNYADTDFPDYVDSSPADGVNDNFDQDGDGLPNHLDPDSNGDGINDYIQAGGDPVNDTNGDGVIDSMEDDDGDGVPNSVDADHADNAGCADVVALGGSYPDGICDSYQPSTMGGGGSANDTDGDGIADEHDPDADGDGLAAEVDSDEGGTELEIVDVDEDGLPNHLDGDSDGDGIPDSVESTSNDGDGDGLADYLDTDADGDGMLDYIEAQSSNAPVMASGSDTDGDGLDNSFDPDQAGTDLSNPTDTDADGTDDYLDTDSDDDGITDLIEANDNNADGVADLTPASADTDNDGLDNVFDPDHGGSFPVRQDTDGDGIPDFRDTDDDGDGIVTITDGTGYTQGGSPRPDYLFNSDYDGDSVADTADPDSDNDGILDTGEDGGTGYDPTGDADVDGTLNYLDLNDDNYAFETDTNSDGIVDAYDFDLDGTPDFHDLDSDNDGITDIIEAGGADVDENGVADGADDDADGLQDVFDSDNGGSLLTITDTDGDGDGNFAPYDIDSDNDGIVDNVEAQASTTYIAPSGNDSDRDGIDNAYDIHATGTYLNPVNTDLNGNPDYLDDDADDDGVADIIEGHDSNKDGFGDWDDNTNGTLNANEGTGDTDEDGLLDAFDSDNASFNSTGSNAAVQDTDGDAIKDFQDVNDDGDGIDTSGEDSNSNGNIKDDFTQGGGTVPDYLYNPDWDQDGINDNIDLDSDNDGILDSEEDGNTGYDPTGDADTDGTLNYLDLKDNNYTFESDTNGDGIIDIYDSDLDGIPDFQDLDSDNDGVFDIVEAGGTDGNDDGEVDGNENGANDANNDGIDDTIGVSGLGIPDSDGDGVADAYDLDSDNDGIPDIKENGGTDTDGNGRADSSADANGNGIADLFEGSPLSVLNNDGDANPNYLDLDSDGDGITDVIEAGGTDADNNGILDSFVDTDNDGFNDVVDPDNSGAALSIADLDGDNLANYIDIDADADGIPDNREAQTTAGYRAPSGSDSDGDGIDNSYDVDNTGAITPVNTDGKDTADYLDTDSDNDGISDRIEGNDADGNGTPDTSPGGTDSDGDGLDDAFEGGVVLQDLDSDGILDWRDTDDDGDGIVTIDEPLDLNPSNGIKDYLENSLGYCGIQSIATDFAGNADAVETNSGVTSPTNSLHGGDNADALFDNIGDSVVLDLTDMVPYDSAITVRYRSSKNNTATVELTASANPSTGFGNPVSLSDNNNEYNNTQYTVGATGGIRYLKFKLTGSNGSANFLLDAVSYQFTQCDPDWDNDAVKDTADNDDDNDGIPDDTEVAAALLEDADSDGILNFEDADYITDANGDGIDDTADFDRDGIPNHKDLDSDNDGLADAIEANVGFLPAGMLDDGRFSVSYVLSNDFDGDGFVNQYDPTDAGTPLSNPDTDMDGAKDFLDLDSDGDGKSDFIEGFDDDESTDALNDYLSRASAYETAAGNPNNYTTADSNGNSDLDNIPDWLEDNDSDGFPNFLDPGFSFLDTDNDGIVNLLDYSNFGSGYTAPDFDSDGTPDYLDTDNPVTLPLDFLGFSGTAVSGQILLEWSTTNEVNVSHFELEYSTTGKDFLLIGKVEAGNVENDINYYTLTHKAPQKGYNFYRVKEVDYDGYFAYTEIINVPFDADLISWNIYPNPATSYLSIQSNAILPNVEIIILDMSGKTVYKKHIPSASNELKLDLSTMDRGVYFLRINLPDKVQTFRIIKQ